MIRSPYQKPELIVVPINPEQAVLSNCSVGANNLSNQNNTSGSCVAGNCRQKNGRGGSDSAASS